MSELQQKLAKRLQARGVSQTWIDENLSSIVTEFLRTHDAKAAKVGAVARGIDDESSTASGKDSHSDSLYNALNTYARQSGWTEPRASNGEGSPRISRARTLESFTAKVESDRKRWADVLTKILGTYEKYGVDSVKAHSLLTSPNDVLSQRTESVWSETEGARQEAEARAKAEAEAAAAAAARAKAHQEARAHAVTRYEAGVATFSALPDGDAKTTALRFLEAQYMTDMQEFADIDTPPWLSESDDATE